MERRNSQEWIKSLKIAIINNDLEKLEKYSQKEIPNFSSLQEAKEALHLVRQAKNIIQKEKQKVGIKLSAFKQQQKYFQTYSNSTFDFKA